ncbi:MAG TPA: TetR/AcrR family transcriptional regulator [Solirubrobacteraceae bacterium]|jgi:AcrR family transcriptional regulator|nr:TetR/AcrR family transcriptional regulator [Solirubrobacteraceae bacterium]
MARSPLGRTRLLEAARAELLATGGTLSVASVAARAGLSTGALYHHFGSRAGLLTAVHEAFYVGLDATLADAWLEPNGSWAERERERLRRFVAYHYTDPLARLLLAHAVDDPDVARLAAEHIRRLSLLAAENIRRGQRQRELDRGVDPDAAGAYAIGGLRQGIAQLLGRARRPSADRATEMLWRLVASTVGV